MNNLFAGLISSKTRVKLLVRFFSTPDEFKSKLEPIEILNWGIHVDLLLWFAGFTQRTQRFFMDCVACAADRSDRCVKPFPKAGK
jgi:hypothetical protein